MRDRHACGGTTVSTVRRRGGPSVETLFEVLTSPRRRFVLTHLSEQDVVSVDALARQLAAWETDRTLADTSDEAHRRARSALYHVHLPKLSTVGLVDYDRERGIAALGECSDAAEPFLALADRTTD